MTRRERSFIASETKYDTIFFDLDGTLLDFHSAEETALREVFTEIAGVSNLESAVSGYRRMNGLYWRMLERGEIAPGEINQKRFEEFAKEFAPEIDPGVLGDSYLSRLAGHATLYGGTIELLKLLAPLCRTALITNGFSETQRAKLAHTGLTDVFEAIVISEEIGAAKPDPTIFEHAAKSLGGIEKSRTLMVGDSLTSDIAGGMRFGIDTCLVTHRNKGQAVSIVDADHPEPTYRIETLGELAPVIFE